MNAVMRRWMRGMLWLSAGVLLQSCGESIPPVHHLAQPPTPSGAGRRLYPVARQGDLTAWLASDHVLPGGEWLYHPEDPAPRYPVVGSIRARDMPRGTSHDGAFVLTTGYGGPLFPLWEGEACEALLFDGKGRWLPVRVSQLEGSVNSWVRVADGRSIGQWSGNPVVIGDPRRPESVVGVMWYKSNLTPELGGTTSGRMLRKELSRLRFEDFVKR
jgi:hypothetical protein